MLLPTFSHADAKLDGERGIAEYQKGNLIEGMSLLEKSAKQGYAPAQSTLAYILDKSELNEQAFHWYQQAAAQQDPAGMYGLATLYADGEGTEKNPQRAAELFHQAANLDHLPAMRAYAAALEHGHLGLAVDFNQALQWYTRAAESGDSNSARRLQQAYGNGELGLSVDPDQASKWQKRTESGE